MRIVHTADWHLCDMLGGIDRTADLSDRVGRVAALCDEHAADVLVIAGDLFSEQASIDDMTAALNDLRGKFKPFFSRGGTVLAVTGNHDRDKKIEMVRAGMQLAVPNPDGGTTPGGRMYLLNGRRVISLAGADGRRVQFVLVPYPFSSRYDIASTAFRNREEENRLLHAEVAKWVASVHTRPDFDLTLPTVLVAHLHVRGTQAHATYKLTERDDVLFDLNDLNTSWAYVALGHIHKPQTLGGADHVRYPGSLDRLDFGDTHEPAVVMVDIDGPRTTVHPPIPVAGTPFFTITLADPEVEIPTLADRYPDRETAIVRITAAPPAGPTSRSEIVKQLRRLFPRLHRFEWTDAATPAGPTAAAFAPHKGFAQTVRDYLTRVLAESNDPDAKAVLDLADTFLHESSET